jgi:hypothetical protein
MYSGADTAHRRLEKLNMHPECLSDSVTSIDAQQFLHLLDPEFSRSAEVYLLCTLCVSYAPIKDCKT